MPVTDGPSLGARLADYVVLANDPDVRGQAVDFWQASRRHYEAVVREITEQAGASGWVWDRYAALAGNPRSIAAYRAFATAAAGLEHERLERLARVVATADELILIDHWLGSGYAEVTDGVSYTELLTWPNAVPFPGAAGGARDVLVVIPFADDAAGARVRNLLACVGALADQSAANGSYAVSVVEASDAPRWRAVIEPAVDSYLYGYKPGAFNKSWAVNVGVINSSFRHRYLCVLDGDILVDRDFARRNLARLRRDGHGAHLPFRWLLNLEEGASSWAIRHRVQGRHPDVPLDRLRGYRKRSPGACLWVRSDVFAKVSGFDERFEGWGGEDDDIDARLAKVAEFRRYDDPVLHLFHPRPVMTAPLSAHLETGVWGPGVRYGDIERYSEPTCSPERPR